MGFVYFKNKHKISIPLLLLHGSRDKITSWKGSNILAQETSENTCFKIFDNCFHELHKELNNLEVFDFISSWLNNLKHTNFKSYVS
ncbi:MAG: alpha/beta hydrolase [Bacteroidales bacterium]|nr:alpha/beta hydrolase [Bacteroidales bacterium]